MDNPDQRLIFAVLTEIGIINQLSRALVESRLPAGLSQTHFGLLNHLSHRPDGETPQQLAHAFQQPKTTMTHMLKVLAKNGFITLAPNANDGRSKLAQITPTGRALLPKVIGEMAPEIAEFVKTLGPETFDDLLPKLQKIRATLDAARD